jgi:F-type H+-transporting ATPase subunit c
MDGQTVFLVVAMAGAALAIAIGVSAVAISQGNVASKAMEGIARQPEVAGEISRTLLIAMAFMESLAIYTLLIALSLIFINPLARFIE